MNSDTSRQPKANGLHGKEPLTLRNKNCLKTHNKPRKHESITHTENHHSRSRTTDTRFIPKQHRSMHPQSPSSDQL